MWAESEGKSRKRRSRAIKWACADVDDVRRPIKRRQATNRMKTKRKLKAVAEELRCCDKGRVQLQADASECDVERKPCPAKAAAAADQLGKRPAFRACIPFT